MTTENKMVYDDKSISVHQNLDHIRFRPSAYLNDRGVDGITHLIREYVDNSIDEIMINPNRGTLYIAIFRSNDIFQIVIRDYGRGIPSKRLREVMTLTGASGKIDAKNAYDSSSGLFGMGAKVGAALSTNFRVLTVNYLEEDIGDLILADGHVVGDVTAPRENRESGVTTIFQLDVARFFPDGADFANSGYLELVTQCRRLNIFNNSVNFQIYLYDRLLPKNIWLCATAEAMNIIYDFLTNRPKTVAYASDTIPDKTAYLFEIWKVNSQPISFTKVEKVKSSPDDRLSFTVLMYYTRKSMTMSAQYFISVNNVIIPDKTENTATIKMMQLIRNKISELQEDDEYKRFVRDEYRFPTLLLAIDIRYNGAELSGTTKNSFRDATFGKQFASEVESKFNELGTGLWQEIATLLQPDIKLRYSQFYDVPVTKSNSRRIFMELNFSRNYYECKGSGPGHELYIVEGQSAGNIVSSRDNEFQAVYTTQGKPTNGATDLEHIVENRRTLTRDKLYQDLMTILNVNPNTTDMSVARFSKIIIATDADADGDHIAALHLNNLYIINPKIITSGMVYIANPPLYSMNITKTYKLFLRNKLALQDALIRLIYLPILDVRVYMNGTERSSNVPALRELYILLSTIGEEFERVSNQLNIPIPILERLVYGYEFIVPKINYAGLRSIFTSGNDDGTVSIRADGTNSSIIVSVGETDYSVGLEGIIEHLHELLYYDKRYAFRRLMFRVSSKVPGALMQNELMTPMGLYQVLRAIASNYEISRYKGLGEMPPESCSATIMCPSTRYITRINGIGDIKTNYSILGKSSDTRKRLLKNRSIYLDRNFSA